MNARLGYPLVTGPRRDGHAVEPRAAGMGHRARPVAALGLLAAERSARARARAPSPLALADVAFTMVANLGFLAEAELLGEAGRRSATTSTARSAATSRPPTAERVMVAAITPAPVAVRS